MYVACVSVPVSVSVCVCVCVLCVCVVCVCGCVCVEAITISCRNFNSLKSLSTISATKNVLSILKYLKQDLTDSQGDPSLSISS